MNLNKTLFMKYGTLILITLQTTVLVLTLRYSRKTSSPNEAYINSTAVLLSEFVKFFICIVVIIYSESIGGLYYILKDEIFGKPKEFSKILVPAFLYTVQNNLLFLALTNLDAATYQVTYQFKIITTALFSRLILHKDLSSRQWFSLFLLMFGVIFVQWPNDNRQRSSSSIQMNENRLIGLFAIIISSLSSGFSGVYFEKLIKISKAQSLWIRNLQLALLSCMFSSFTIILNDLDEMNIKGFFYGYNSLTFMVIGLQAFGGICVSLVMKYADNILKGFATTISIILSSLCSHFIFNDFSPSLNFLIGASLVVLSTMMYSLPMSSGKSTLIKYLALLTGRLEPPDIMSIQISDQIDTKYLLGSYITSEIPGEFVFNFGPLLKAIRDGNWIIFEDIDSASSELISSLVSIIESRNNGNIIGYEDKIDRFNNNFRIFFTKTLQKSDSIQSVNFTMLEKICYKVCLENFTKNQITDLIQKKWPNLNILLPRILEVYENLMNFQSETKPKRLIWVRDLLKWCNRLSKYFMKIQSEEISKFAYLDAMDCFTMFTSNRLKQQIAYTIGSCFNLSKNDCEHLIQQRNPKIIKNINQITIGRQSIEIDSKFSQNISDFAFTLNTTQLLERLLAGVSNQEPILLCGETGVGKTSTIQYLSNICGHRLNIINMNQQSSSLELFGGYKPVDFNSMIISIKEEYCKLFDQTFETKKNSAFKEKFDKLYFKQNWNLIIEIMINVCMKAFDKIEKENRKELLFEKWTKVQEKLKKLKSIMENGKKNQLTFTFIDGILTNAINNGEWILLDEINLAENETLQGLLSFLENDQTLMLFEKSTNQMIKVHKNFRLFACMNPATDVGKKELPIKIRNRFTEFFIDECDDRSQLRIIVCTYIQSMVDPKTIESIVEFYFQLKYDSKTLLKDMNGHRPIFSLRNLCRALQVIKYNPFQSINRSIYEAFSLAFLSNLDQQSYLIVQKMIERIIFHNKNLKFSESMKNMEKLFPLKNFVIIENYPIIKGPNEPFIDDNYILTATVSKNLRDVCRIISAGRTYPILLQGETSVGKTSLIQWLAQATGNICHRVNNHEHTDLQEYIGSYCSQTNGKIIFKNGILIEAMKNGHWIILDELNLAPTEVLEALNRVLDENRECFIAETQELIKAHSRFLLFATQNPPGKYAGRKVLSRAFRNRFIELNFNEIPIEELEIILHKKCMIPLSYSKRMVSVLTQLQKCRCKSDIFAGKHGFITLRDLFRWGYRYMKFAAKLDEKIRFFDWNQFLANQGFMLLAGRVRQKDDVILIEEILEKIFKCKISQEELFYSNEKKFESKTDIFSNTLVWTNAFKRLGTLIKEAIEFEEPILLVGETGCGKTTICQYFSSINQKTLKIINCHMNTESSDFLGSLRPNRNACIEQNEMLFEWIDGPLVMAMKNGDYFLVDEISLADDSVLERLNSVLELERTIFLAENNDSFGRIKANETFRYFATMNPGGDFGKKELSPALRDRFTEIWCPGFENMDDIYQIAFHNLEIIDDEIKQQISYGIRNFIQWFEQQIVQKHFIISVRDILSWTKFIDKTYSIKPQKLSLYDSFIHGAYLVYIDPFIIGNQSLLANKIDEIKMKCQKYLENLCEKFRNILSESENNSSFSNENQISIGPFSLPKLNQQNSPENYYWQSNGVHNNCIRLMRALQLDKPILLEGSPGVGKTSLIQALSSICCDSLIRINLSDQTDISDLFGCDLPVEGEGNAGKFEFRDGPFLTALKSQKSTWILLDELNLATQTVLEGLNACLDHRSEIFISELNKTFSVNKKQTRIFATQNPYSMDRSRKRLPKSFLNRFTIVYIEDLTDNDYYFILINMFPKISTNIIQRMISVNRKICEQIQNFSKKGSPFEFNLRDLIRWIQLFDKFQGKYSNIEPELFFNQIYTNKMRTIECKQKIQQICQEEFVNFKCQQTTPTMTYLNNSLFQMGSIISSRLVNNIDNRNIHYCFHQQFSIIESILICIEMNWLSILIGDSGIGKSHLIQLIANICGQQLNIIHANSEMDTIDLLGGFEQKDFNVDIKNLENEIVRYGFGEIVKQNHQLWSKFWSYIYRLSTNNLSKFKLKTMKKILNLFEDPQISSEFRNRLEKLETKIIENHNQDNGTFEWRDSSLVKSIQNGEWIVIENANLLNPAVLDRFNSLLEPDGCLTINEKGSIDGRITEIRPHQNFRLFFTMNPKYGELSRAMRNRGIEIVMLNENEDQLNSSMEEYRKILQEYGIPDQQEIEQMNRR
uniref:Midasin n=1 Tax=Dermatophagoides pteronyssinus TaxID=6956 RepID=A0A6P6YJ38_DERPT